MRNIETSKLKALSDIASIDITLKFETIFKKVLNITCKTMNAHSGTIMFVDENTGNLEMVSSYGLSENYIDEVHAILKKNKIPLSSSPSGIVLNTGKYYVVPDVYKEPRFKPWLHLSKKYGFSSIIFTPMKKGVKVIGLLNVYMKNPHNFTNEEIDFLTVASSQASSLVQNARICNKLKNSINEIDKYKLHLEDELKKSYRELYDSEKYLSTVIESSFDGIFVIDNEGKFERGNGSFFRIIGWTEKELMGQHFMKVIHPDMKDFMMERWNEIQNDVELSYETKIVTSNGEIKHLNVSCSFANIKGERKYVVIIKDISEKKKLLLELKESEAKYRGLFENAVDSICTYDINGYLLTINDAGVKMLNCDSKDEVIGTHISKWLTPESLKISENFTKKNVYVIKEKSPILEIICNDGEHKWIGFSNTVIKENGKVIAIHGIGRDITEKVKLEKSLMESEAKYRGLFENAVDGISIVDEAGYFQDVNDSLLKMHGCTRDEIINTHFSKWVTTESLENIYKIRENLLKGEDEKEEQIIELICKNGKNKYVEFKKWSLRYGNTKLIQSIGRDITEKLKMQQQLDKAHHELENSYKELKELDRMKTELMSNVTHELLTPMTPIMSYSDLLLSGDMGYVNEQQKKALEAILRNSKRLTKIIQSLIDIKVTKLKIELVSMNEIISKSLEDLKFQAEEKQIELISEIQPLSNIKGDKDKLTQVMINILSNAIKFTPKNGKITTTCCEIENGIKFSVSDTGIGISEDKMPYIFDRFFQIDSSLNRKYDGVGLGLAICKNIVLEHKGKIWAESKGEGFGTTFHVELPLICSFE